MTNNEFLKIEELVLKNKKYDEAINILEKNSLFDCKLLLANTLFLSGKLDESLKVFKELKSFYHIGYIYLMLGNVDEGLRYFKMAPSSPAQNWSLFFCELFTKKVTTVPTYLQIRCFLERDLSLFLKFNLEEFVQKTIDISDFLEQINPETNKIIARTFLYNDYPEYAKEYFIRAFDYTQEDAELYYLSGLYYEKINNIREAKKSFEKALYLNSNYVPAKEHLEQIKNELI